MKAYKRIKKLTEVVSQILENSENSVVVADIGADHGYLSESLSRLEKIDKILAVEISEKCLNKVKKLKEDFNLEKVEPILGDGLENIQSVDISVIAGIGGYEIINILKNQNSIDNGNKCNIFVLQPSDNFVELKDWVNQNNIFILRDFVFESAKRFYPVIVIDVSKEHKATMTDFDLYLGRDSSLEDVEFVNYLRYLKESLSYLDNLPQDRINADDELIQKQKLKILIEKLLEKC